MSFLLALKVDVYIYIKDFIHLMVLRNVDVFTMVNNDDVFYDRP